MKNRLKPILDQDHTAHGVALPSRPNPTVSTLLEKALAEEQGRRGGPISEEDIELALAWAHDQVGMTQVMRAKSIKNTGSVYIYLAQALREAARRGNF